MPMKAKCPHCTGGCERCDLGFVDVTFPSGPEVKRYTLVCSCGCAAGGGFRGGRYGSTDASEILKDKGRAICPACGHGFNLRVEI